MKTKPDQHYCRFLVDDKAIEDLKDDRVEGGDDESHIQGKWNHCVDQQQDLCDEIESSFQHLALTDKT